MLKALKPFSPGWSVVLRRGGVMGWGFLLLIMVAVTEAHEGRLYRIYDDMAKCLDGTPPAYYFRPGSGSGSNKWLLFYEGGGWCGSTDECYQRSWSDLGSSSSYKDTMWMEEEVLSPGPDTNPLLHNWNVVYVKYCDGGFWTGNRLDTDIYRGRLLYYRGKFINQALITDLQRNRGMGDTATSDVLVTGCSAGGVQTFLNIDYIAALINNNGNNINTRVIGMPDSGFLYPYRGPGQCDYEGHMASTYQLMNSSWVLQQCIHTFPGTGGGGESWRCLFFAQYLLPFITTPLFVLNSRYDSWQTTNLYCSQGDGDTTSSLRSERINEFGRQFSSLAFWPAFLLSNSNKQQKNGYVLDSCEHHCGGWTTISTDDGRSQRQAFEDYYYHYYHQPQQRDGNSDGDQQLQPPPPQQQPQSSAGLLAAGGGGLLLGGNNTGLFPCQQCCHNGHNSNNRKAALRARRVVSR